jgi:hypothetical protein
MPPPIAKSRGLWLTLISIAGIPRILAAFFLPNTFGDAYVYIRDIGVMSSKLKAGTFAITDFYGFWLPLYQFLAALLNVFVGNGFYSGKLVSAMFGVGACLLVYAITAQLTLHKTAALMAFLLIAINPIHILTSSSALTDVPHGFFVLATLYFVLKREWLVAAIFAALAGLTRVESWMFIALIPLIQFLWERRVSIPAVLIMLLPPLLWFYVSWKAAGDWLACFKVRQQYHDWLLQQNPALAHFSFYGVMKDGAIFINSIDIAVLVAAFIAGWVVIKRVVSGHGFKDESVSILPPVIFFFAFFALLVVAYLTHQQPIMFSRYGLILFSLGIPVLAWTYLRFSPLRSLKLLTAIIIVCVVGASIQLVGAVGLLNQISAQRAAADYLRDHFDPKSDARIFCDEGTVTVMSGIPAEKFVTSAAAPRDTAGFLEFLKAQNVEWLVVVKKDESTPSALFPESEYGEPVGSYKSVMGTHVGFLPMNIHIYRVTRGFHAEGVK